LLPFINSIPGGIIAPPVKPPPIGNCGSKATAVSYRAAFTRNSLTNMKYPPFMVAAPICLISPTANLKITFPLAEQSLTKVLTVELTPIVANGIKPATAL